MSNKDRIESRRTAMWSAVKLPDDYRLDITSSTRRTANIVYGDEVLGHIELKSPRTGFSYLTSPPTPNTYRLHAPRIPKRSQWGGMGYRDYKKSESLNKAIEEFVRPQSADEAELVRLKAKQSTIDNRIREYQRGMAVPGYEAKSILVQLAKAEDGVSHQAALDDLNGVVHKIRQEIRYSGRVAKYIIGPLSDQIYALEKSIKENGNGQ